MEERSEVETTARKDEEGTRGINFVAPKDLMLARLERTYVCAVRRARVRTKRKRSQRAVLLRRKLPFHLERRKNVKYAPEQHNSPHPTTPPPPTHSSRDACPNPPTVVRRAHSRK